MWAARRVVMFILTKLKDNVRVEPADLGRPTAEAVTACLEGNFINKVLTEFPVQCTEQQNLKVECVSSRALVRALLRSATR